MTTSMKRHAHRAIVVISIVFLILGFNDHTSFVAIGAAFIAIGAATARRQKEKDPDPASAA